MKPRTQPIDVGIITRRGATTGDDGPILKVRLASQKKVQFDVDIDKDMFFEARDTIQRYPDNFIIYEMFPIFYSTLLAGPSRKNGTL